ncbi:MAG: cation:proton antiporter [Ilumatobacteraceae bacterium]|nr:cation:proton antiporter [Ilumatobacteraceae bacterium]
MTTDVRSTTEFAFLVLVITIMVMPILAQRLRLPPLIGLLIGGMIISPSGLGLLEDLGVVSAIGEIGLLYLLFLVGIGIDLKTFERYRNTAITFGLLTAAFPGVLGVVVARAEGFSWTTAFLIGSFWMSFTLVAYPTVKQFGLVRNQSMAATVGASAITDTMSLVALGILVGVELTSGSTWELFVEIALGLAVVLFYSVVALRVVAKWFFASLGQDRELRFVMALAGFLSAAVIAEAVNIEPLLGAFFAGVGMNRLVPNQSALMGRIEFFGNSLFIPAFLVSVGVLIDPTVVASWETIRLGLLFTAALAGGKVIAAVICGRIYKFPWPDVGMMFSLSIAQAAATLAAAVVGLNAGFFDEVVLNAVMVVVFISLIISTVGANYSGARMEPTIESGLRLGETIVVPVSAKSSDPGTLDLASRIADSDGGVLVPLVVAVTSEPDRIADRRADLESIKHTLGRLGLTSDPELRVDRSVAGGVDRLASERNASLVLLTRPRRRNVRELMFGGTNDEIAATIDRPVAVVSLTESRARAKEIPIDADASAHGEPDHERQHSERSGSEHDDRDHHGSAARSRRDRDLEDRSEWYRRVLFAATPADLSPGLSADTRLALELACNLDETTHHHLTVGPLTVDHLRGLDVELPENVAHIGGPDDRNEWIDQHATARDLIVVPARGNPFTTLDVLHRDDRSIVAVAFRHDARWYSTTEASIGITVPR